MGGWWCKNGAINTKVVVCIFTWSKSTDFGVYVLIKRSWMLKVAGSLLLFFFLLLLCEPKGRGICTDSSSYVSAKSSNLA